MSNDLIRKDFSLLDGKFYYFNNASTSLKPNCVLKSLEDLYQNHNDLFGGDYQNSDFVTEEIFKCRKLVAQLINCDAEEVIFTSNCTDSLDRLAQIVDVKEGDNIVCSMIDHNANLIPWKKRGANIFLLKTSSDGTLDLDELENILQNNEIKIISLLAMSNTAGNIQPFKKISTLAHKYGVLVCIDFSQYIPHFAANFKDTDCDFGCFSAHKIGSSCFGVLVGKKNVLEQCRQNVYVKNLKNFFEQYEIPLKTIPQCFEFGSLQIADIVALSSAIKYYLNLGYEKIFEIEKDLKNYFLQKAEETGCIKFLFPIQKNYAPIFSFRFRNENVNLLEANKILLNDYKISLSCGTQCAQSLYQHYGYKMGLRASCSFYNTKEEIDYLFEKLKIVSKS